MTEVILIHRVFYDAKGKSFCYHSDPLDLSPKCFGPKKDLGKIVFTVYMQIEPSATEKVNF